MRRSCLMRFSSSSSALRAEKRFPLWQYMVSTFALSCPRPPPSRHLFLPLAHSLPSQPPPFPSPCATLTPSSPPHGRERRGEKPAQKTVRKNSLKNFPKNCLEKVMSHRIFFPPSYARPCAMITCAPLRTPRRTRF